MALLGIDVGGTSTRAVLAGGRALAAEVPTAAHRGKGGSDGG